MDIVDGDLGYLVAKLSALPLVTSPYYSKHVACTLQQLSVGRADVNRRGRGGTQRLADSFKLCVPPRPLRFAILFIQAKYAVGAGQSPLGAQCNITLQRFCERGLFSHVHSPRGAICNVTRNPL